MVPLLRKINGVSRQNGTFGGARVLVDRADLDALARIIGDANSLLARLLLHAEPEPAPPAVAPPPVEIDDVERLLDVYAVAERLGVSTATVWRMRKDGEIVEPLHLGKLTRWRAGDFTAWLAAKSRRARRSGKGRTAGS
jgi:predicted DNA-binding transcriptional regulator AlpA